MSAKYKALSKAEVLTLTTLTVPKSRRPRFDLKLHIIDLNNVPLVSGTSFVKWDLPSSTAAEHRGKSSKCSIKDHKVTYDYDKTIPVRLVVGKDGMLQECWIHFEVLQEYQSGGRVERIVLGLIKLNLAEYVPAGQNVEIEGEGESISRRYLMQESKINSTLKVDISMKQVEGDHNYSAPPLRSAPVFGGIAGIVSHEAAEVSEEIGHMPSLSSKSREVGELQDMYRRTLAASWAAQPGELRADECIEDIFAGGDGWGSRVTPSTRPPVKTRQTNASTASNATHATHDDEASDDDRDYRSRGSRRRSIDSGSRKSSRFRHKKPTPAKSNLENGRRGDQFHRHFVGGSTHGVTGRTAVDQQVRDMKKTSKHGKRPLWSHEVDEFDNPWRDDLTSWKIRDPGVARV